MNVEQLENILKQTELIEMLIEDDTRDSLAVTQDLQSLQTTVNARLKEYVWRRYLTERDK